MFLCVARLIKNLSVQVENSLTLRAKAKGTRWQQTTVMFRQVMGEVNAAIGMRQAEAEIAAGTTGGLGLLQLYRPPFHLHLRQCQQQSVKLLACEFLQTDNTAGRFFFLVILCLSVTGSHNDLTKGHRSQGRNRAESRNCRKIPFPFAIRLLGRLRG